MRTTKFYLELVLNTFKNRWNMKLVDNSSKLADKIGLLAFLPMLPMGIILTFFQPNYWMGIMILSFSAIFAVVTIMSCLNHEAFLITQAGEERESKKKIFVGIEKYEKEALRDLKKIHALLRLALQIFFVGAIFSLILAFFK